MVHLGFGTTRLWSLIFFATCGWARWKKMRRNMKMNHLELVLLQLECRLKKASVSSPSFSLHQQPWLPPPPKKKTALRIPKKVTLKNVDDVTGQVQCMHYLVGGEGWLSTILGFLPEMDYVSPILITSQPLFKYMNLDILHLDDVWYSTLTNPHISWSKE